MKISMGYPTAEEELEIMERAENGADIRNVTSVMSVDDVEKMISEAAKTVTAPSIKQYIIDLTAATRNSDYVKLGVSPRGSIALLKASKAYAFVEGRWLCCSGRCKGGYDKRFGSSSYAFP